jgi:hypothetical protein
VRRPVDLVPLAFLAFIAAGCLSVPPPPSPATTAPSVSPSDQPTTPAALPYGCWAVREPDCVEAVAGALQAAVDRGPFVYGEVSLSCPAAPCPQEVLPGVVVSVILERDRRSPLEVKLQHDGERFVSEVAEAGFMMMLEPSSGPAAVGVPFPYAIGHCGLYTGIDADGSWWDPIGLIDTENPDTINSAKATMLITDRNTAVLQTARLRVDLVRHPGPKSFRGCA